VLCGDNNIGINFERVVELEHFFAAMKLKGGRR